MPFVTMIVTTPPKMTSPTNDIGVDKLTLFVKDFGVKSISDCGFLVQPSTIDLSTGCTTDQLLFKDRYGVEVNGSKAFLNTDLAQYTMNGRGLMIQFNPSKPYHPYNLVSDDRVLGERVQNVFNEIMQKGFNADWKNALLIRMDLAKNILLDNPVSAYGNAFNCINMNRSKYVRQYPSGYGTSNDSWGVILYDKGEESGEYEGNNLLRGEIQFKRHRKIVDAIGCKYVGQLGSLGMGALKEVYRDTMRDKVLKVSEYSNQYTIHYADEINLLKMLKAKSERTAIGNHLQQIGMPNFLEMYGSPKVYADVLEKAGFSKMTVSRQMKKIREQIDLFAMINKDDRNTVGKMLRELTFKLVA
jgi:hypothetical protein